MRTGWLAGMIIVVACERGGDQQPAAAREDTVQAAAPTAAVGGDTSDIVHTPEHTAMERGTIIDAHSTRIGQRVADLQVASVNITTAPATPLGVAGSIAFRGEVQLTGGYRAHYDYPDVKEPCFWVDPGEWAKLPRVKGDDRIKWFCFTNQQDAIRALGALGTDTRATIVIDDYRTNLQQSNVWDTARLVRVVRKGS